MGDLLYFVFLHDDFIMFIIITGVTFSERHSQSAMLASRFIFFASSYLIFFIEYNFIQFKILFHF